MLSRIRSSFQLTVHEFRFLLIFAFPTSTPKPNWLAQCLHTEVCVERATHVKFGMDAICARCSVRLFHARRQQGGENCSADNWNGANWQLISSFCVQLRARQMITPARAAVFHTSKAHTLSLSLCKLIATNQPTHSPLLSRRTAWARRGGWCGRFFDMQPSEQHLFVSQIICDATTRSLSLALLKLNRELVTKQNIIPFAAKEEFGERANERVKVKMLPKLIQAKFWLGWPNCLLMQSLFQQLLDK